MWEGQPTRDHLLRARLCPDLLWGGVGCLVDVSTPRTAAPQRTGGAGWGAARFPAGTGKPLL